MPFEEVAEKLIHFKLEEYTPAVFAEREPTQNGVQESLAGRAQFEITSWKFWQLEKLRREFVENNLEREYLSEVSRWKERKASFEEEERVRAIEKNAQYEKDYQEKRALVESILTGDSKYVAETLEEIFSEIELPLEFSINYEVVDKEVKLDLDLPEIEDYPTVKSDILKSGKLSVKQKTQTEINRDYATSVVGLGFFFAGIIFNISPAITTVSIAGYTQRVNRQNGNLEDEYVYSIAFDRNIFSSMNIAEVDPLQAIHSFRNTINISSSYELAAITL